MTAAGCETVTVTLPPSICIGHLLSGPSTAVVPRGATATDGPSARDDEELIYKTRTRRGSE